jgi:protein O-mannosyl-transferase
MDTQKPALAWNGWTTGRISICLIVVSLLTYLPALWCDFVEWDDPLSVTRNPAVAAGLTSESILYAFTTFDSGNWIPLTWLSYELDATLFGLNPAGFHATNIILHACNVWMLFLVLNRLTESSGLGAVVALFYAIHPLHVESVAWVSERKDVLSTFWMLAALLMYEHYARQPTITRLVATGLLMTLGLLAKQMLVTLPILLLLLDVWPMRRIVWTGLPQPIERENRYSPALWWKAVLEKLPLFVLSLIAGMITLVAQRANMSKESVIPAWNRVANAIQACDFYLWKTISPTGLSAFYPHPTHAINWQIAGLAASLLLAFTVFSVWWARRRPYILFGWLWFLVTLLPVLGLVQVGKQAYADRYVYVPHIGLFVLIVWGAHEPLAKFKGGLKAGMLLVVVGGVVCVSLTRSQISTWQNTRALWTHALSIDPSNYLALSAMGVIHFHEQKFETAQEDFMQAVISNPHDCISIYWLGRLCCEREEWDQAVQYFSWVLRIDPEHEEASHDLAIAIRKVAPQSNDRVQAAPAIPAAVDKVRIGLKLARKQSVRRVDLESALRSFEEATRIDPTYAGAHVNAAITCRELGRRDEAIRHFRQAIELEPGRQEHHTDLAQVLELDNRLIEAKSQYEAALSLNPADVESRIHVTRLKKLVPQ